MSTNAVPDPKTPPSRRRRIGIATLLVIGCVFTALAAVAVWARTTALDTDAYVDTVAELPQDPAVATALAHNVVDLVLGDGLVEQQLRERLPEDLAFLSAPVAGAIRDVALESAERFAASEGFQTAWERINRAAHHQAVAVLTGRSAVSVADDGKVTLDVTEIASAVRSQLDDVGLGDVLPPPRDEVPALVLFEVGDHGLLELTVDLLDLTYWLLPMLAIGAFGVAIVLSGDRRRTLAQVGIGVAVAGVLSLTILHLARGFVLDAVLDPVNQAAIAALWDQLFAGLANRLVAQLVMALVVAGGTFLAGPNRWVVSVRGSVWDLRPGSEVAHDRV